MNVVAAMVRMTLRQMRRDRSAVVFLVLLPAGLMVLMGNIYAAEDGAAPRVALLAEPGDAAAAALVTTLEGSGAVELVAVGDRQALDDAVRRRHVEAGVVVGAGRTISLVGPPEVQLPAGVRFVVDGAVRRVDRAAAVAEVTGSDLQTVLAGLPDPVQPPAEDPAEARAEAAIGILVLVTFMNLLAYGSMIPTHRSLGVLDRLAAVPAGGRAVLAGYATTYVVVAAVQVAVALVVGTAVVGIGWGPPLQVVAITLGLAVAAGGVGVAAGTMLPNPESGSTIGGPVGFAIGMLGGCFWPLEFVGGVLQDVGRWVPHQWAIAALGDIRDGGVTAGALVGPVVGLLAVGALGAAMGTRRLQSSWR